MRVGLKAAWFLAAVIALAAAPAHADQRVKLDLDVALNRHDGSDLVGVPRVAARSEQRWVDGRRYYSKYFLGLRYDLSKTVSLAGYWAHREFRLLDVGEHLAVADVIVRGHTGGLFVWDRNRSEWHFGGHYYRYRNKLEVSGEVGWGTLRVYGAQELRIDSDQRRLNVFELEAGVRLHPKGPLRLKIYVARQWFRRHLPDWHDIDILGLVIGFRV